MNNTSESENKPIGNGITNGSDDSANTSEQEPCLPSDLKEKNNMDMTDTLDSKHLDTEIMKQNKKRHGTNAKPQVSVWMAVKNSFISAVKYLCEKTGLSNLGLSVATFILLLLVICLVTLLVLGIVWPIVPHELRFPVCRRSACLRSSSHVSYLSLHQLNFLLYYFCKEFIHSIKLI